MVDSKPKEANGSDLPRANISCHLRCFAKAFGWVSKYFRRCPWRLWSYASSSSVTKSWNNTPIPFHELPIIDQTMNIVVKDTLKLSKKPIKHVWSFPILQAFIQHWFREKMIFEKPYLVCLSFLLVLSKFWAWLAKFNPYFSCMLEILLIWKDQNFQHIWIVENWRELLKFYKSTF